MMSPRPESCLLGQAPEVILVKVLILLLRLAKTFDLRNRRILQSAASAPNEVGRTILDEVMVTSSWENFKSASTARVLVVLSSWSRGWRQRWSEVFTELARELRISGDYTGAASFSASALWSSRVVITQSRRAWLFAEIAQARLLAHKRKEDERPARYALRDAQHALDAYPKCASAHAARGTALVTFGRHSEACQAYEQALATNNSGLTTVERKAIDEALNTQRKSAAAAHTVHLELCLAGDFSDEPSTKRRCAIRSDAPLRSLLDTLHAQPEDSLELSPALFVVTDDYDLPSDFWRSNQRQPRLRNVCYLDPESTPNRAALMPGTTATLGEGTNVFCAWPSSKNNASSIAKSLSPPFHHSTTGQAEAKDQNHQDYDEDTNNTIPPLPPPFGGEETEPDAPSALDAPQLLEEEEEGDI